MSAKQVTGVRSVVGGALLAFAIPTAARTVLLVLINTQ